MNLLPRRIATLLVLPCFIATTLCAEGLPGVSRPQPLFTPLFQCEALVSTAIGATHSVFPFAGRRSADVQEGVRGFPRPRTALRALREWSYQFSPDKTRRVEYQVKQLIRYRPSNRPGAEDVEDIHRFLTDPGNPQVDGLAEVRDSDPNSGTREALLAARRILVDHLSSNPRTLRLLTDYLRAPLNSDFNDLHYYAHTLERLEKSLDVSQAPGVLSRLDADTGRERLPATLKPAGRVPKIDKLDAGQAQKALRAMLHDQAYSNRPLVKILQDFFTGEIGLHLAAERLQALHPGMRLSSDWGGMLIRYFVAAKYGLDKNTETELHLRLQTRTNFTEYARSRIYSASRSAEPTLALRAFETAQLLYEGRRVIDARHPDTIYGDGRGIRVSVSLTDRAQAVLGFTRQIPLFTSEVTGGESESVNAFVARLLGADHAGRVNQLRVLVNGQPVLDGQRLQADDQVQLDGDLRREGGSASGSGAPARLLGLFLAGVLGLMNLLHLHRSVSPDDLRRFTTAA